MSDIQQRIADAIQKQAELNLDCDRDIDEDPHDHWLDLAAAVVSELGLTREFGEQFELGANWPKEGGLSRYVTEWVPNG